MSTNHYGYIFWEDAFSLGTLGSFNFWVILEGYSTKLFSPRHREGQTLWTPTLQTNSNVLPLKKNLFGGAFEHHHPLAKFSVASPLEEDSF